ncbi:Spermatogenesis-associated protein 17 [Nibea albiflora]|uniref:Spermatogenesis-associated protein 17 n=1 Tax=Nibea albiflora TaxID=240163 RepID=A0ACB7EH68_NIBAL|nr:Spermatogenesis-associated protein 17 [Nibea albiflora]
MAELLKIKSQVKEFQQEYVDKNRHAEENRQKENQAATQIQSWFRACKVRAYLSHLHKQAVIIQKIWRGFTARARFRQMVKAAYFIMKMNFYEEMAVRVNISTVSCFGKWSVVGDAVSLCVFLCEWEAPPSSL